MRISLEFGSAFFHRTFRLCMLFNRISYFSFGTLLFIFVEYIPHVKGIRVLNFLYTLLSLHLTGTLCILRLPMGSSFHLYSQFLMVGHLVIDLIFDNLMIYMSWVSNFVQGFGLSLKLEFQN